MFWKINKQTNKQQTNKQTNKQTKTKTILLFTVDQLTFPSLPAFSEVDRFLATQSAVKTENTSTARMNAILTLVQAAVSATPLFLFTSGDTIARNKHQTIPDHQEE